MKKIIQTEVCTFDELTPDQQSKVLDNLRFINTDHEWYEYKIDYFKEMLSLIGFEGVTISFSGFYSQGDGASFTATHYSYAKNAAAKILKDSPKDTIFSTAANDLQALQSRYFYGIHGKVVRKTHHYSHENTVEAEVYDKNDGWLKDEDNKLFNSIIRQVMRNIYRKLEKESDYLTSDEAVKETIEANNYFFDPLTCKIT